MKLITMADNSTMIEKPIRLRIQNGILGIRILLSIAYLFPSLINSAIRAKNNPLI